MAPVAVGHALVAALTKQELCLEGGEPMLLGQPDFVPEKLQLRPSKPWVPQSSSSPTRVRRYEGHRLTAEVRWWGTDSRMLHPCL